MSPNHVSMSLLHLFSENSGRHGLIWEKKMKAGRLFRMEEYQWRERHLGSNTHARFAAPRTFARALRAHALCKMVKKKAFMAYAGIKAWRGGGVTALSNNNAGMAGGSGVSLLINRQRQKSRSEEGQKAASGEKQTSKA